MSVSTVVGRDSQGPRQSPAAPRLCASFCAVSISPSTCLTSSSAHPGTPSLCVSAKHLHADCQSCHTVCCPPLRVESPAVPAATCHTTVASSVLFKIQLFVLAVEFPAPLPPSCPEAEVTGGVLTLKTIIPGM